MADDTRKEVEGSETGEPENDIDDSGFEETLFGDDEPEEADEKDGDGGEDKPGGEGDDKETEADEEAQGKEDDSDAEGKDGDEKNEPGEDRLYHVIHLDRPVSVKEADVVPLLQKGLDYDYVKGERDRMRTVINFYAEQSGMAPADYLNHVTTNMGKISHEAAKRAVEAERPDLDEAAISEMAHARVARQREDAAAKQREAAARTAAARNEQFLTFVRKFPGVKPEEIPADVVAAVRNGANLTEEYSAYKVRAAEQKIAELEAKAKAAAKNEENKSKALGSMGTSGGEGERDAFLEGFES